MQPRDLSDHSPYVPGRGVEEVARDRGLDPDDLIKLSSNENPPRAEPGGRRRDPRARRPRPPVPEIFAHRPHREAGRSGTCRPSRCGSRRAPTARSTTSRGPRWSPATRCSCRNRDSPTTRCPPGTTTARSLSTLSPDDGFAQDAETVLSAYGGERIVYLTSPHKPSGSVMPLDEVRAIADATAEETLVVVDEAYGEFAEVDSAIPLVDERDDVACCARTFSKAYGLAGLRIGYSVVPEAWGEAYARVNTPFAANELACRAALAAPSTTRSTSRSRSRRHAGRASTSRDELDAPTVESAGNFVLAEVGDAERVAEEAQERGVIIRDCTSFGLPNHVRISTGTRARGPARAVARLNETLADLGLGVRA